MKKIVALLAIMAFIALVGLFWLSAPDNELANLSQVAGTSVALTTLEKTVFLQEKNSNLALEIETFATTTTGSTVETGPFGRALLEGAGYKTVLDYNSSLVLESEINNQNKLRLISGTVWSRIEKVLEQGEFHEIKTPNAVAVVRGTALALGYKNNTSTLLVAEGSVSFFELDETGQIISNSEIVVPAGNKATRLSNKEIVVSKLTQTDQKTDWYQFLISGEKPTPQAPAPKPEVKIQTTPKVPAISQPAASLTPTTPIKSTPSSSEPKPTPPPATTEAVLETTDQSTSPKTTVPDETAPAPTTVKPFSITTVTPSRIPVGSRDPISISGQGFKDITVILLSEKAINDLDIITDTLIKMIVSDLKAGTYDLTLHHKDGRVISQTKALTIYQTQTSDLQNTIAPESINLQFYDSRFQEPLR